MAQVHPPGNNYMIINLTSQQICFLFPTCSVDLFREDPILSDMAASFRKGKPSSLLTPTQLVSLIFYVLVKERKCSLYLSSVNWNHNF